MVVMAYLAGLISTPAAVLGAFGGMWWWRAYRRAQAEPGPVELTPLVPPPPSPPQDAPRNNRLSMRSRPGGRRHVHGKRR